MHDIAATCVLKMPLNPNHPSIHPSTSTVCPSIDPLLPYVTAIINASLREGYLPAEQKHAVVTPLLKKPGLDADELGIDPSPT